MIKQKSLKKLAAVFAQAQINSAGNTDEQALKVSALYPDFLDFGEGETMEVGTRVNYNGILYKVIQSHQKQELWTPRNVPSLFSRVLIPNKESIHEWIQPDSTNAYMKGDKVTHNGITWESLTDLNTWEPGAEGTDSVWGEV